MSYTALYRKFRPQTFKDVKGQEHIVKTLKNQVNAKRLTHAYIFCGTRGTGKTTIAKIMARMVNCEHPTEDGPCGECDSCKAVQDGTSMNVIEIDAASNNGVENVREIIEEVSYSPVNGKYKVYIIDEVHMLSTGAFNALLKTLEEPPSYVIFILATTDVHKVPITILSRCQRYDFKRIGIDIISDRLKELCEEEQLNVDDKALKYVAKVADGSMRDALSLLDQCIAFNFGENLTYEKTLDILGAVDNSVFSKMLRIILKDDVLGAIDLLEEIVMQGRELTQFVTDFVWYLRNLMLVKSCDDAYLEDVLEVSSDNLVLLKEEASMIELNTIFRYINIFSELSSRMKYASQKRILLEMTIVKLCRPQMENDSDSLLERIRVVEDKVEKGVTVTMVANDLDNTAQPRKTTEPKVLPKSIPDDIKKIVKDWPIIVGNSKDLNKPLLNKSMLSVGDDGSLIIGVTEKIKQMKLNETEKREEIEQMLSEYIGKEVHYRVEMAEDRQDFGDRFADLQTLLNFDIKRE